VGGVPKSKSTPQTAQLAPTSSGTTSFEHNPFKPFVSGGTTATVETSAKFAKPKKTLQLPPTASNENKPYDTTTFSHEMSVQIAPKKDKLQ